MEKFIAQKTPWIEKHLELMKSRRESDPEKNEPFTEAEIAVLKEKARAIILPKVERFAQQINVSFGKVTIRKQLTRWGSCSSDGNLSFNCLLTLCPDEVVNYLIIHELCHRKYMDHSDMFWSTVRKYCPEYEKQRAWLKENGDKLIMRLRSDC